MMIKTLLLVGVATAATFSSSDPELTFELNGCSTRTDSCPEGVAIGDYYRSAGAVFTDTFNVYTGYATQGFAACNGPHSGWGNAMMEINFVVPGTTNPATVSKFGARFIGPSSSATVHFYNSAGQLIMTKTPTVVASASGGEDSWGAADIAKITIEGSSYAVEDVRFDTPVVIAAPTSANEATFTCDSELVQFWTAPSDGTVTTQLDGASGGLGGNGDNKAKAGYGGVTTGSFTVSAGEQLKIIVGCEGATGSCSTCSGAGGGASGIERTDGTVVAVAGGGGGGAASNHQTAYTSANHGHGGEGGGLEGGRGGADGCYCNRDSGSQVESHAEGEACKGGDGGSQTTPGSGSAGNRGMPAGLDGSANNGGSCGNNVAPQATGGWGYGRGGSGCANPGDGGGGGGGSGYKGGGGGGTGCHGTGGGGGSSFCSSAATSCSIAQGSFGNSPYAGQITISFTAAPVPVYVASTASAVSELNFEDSGSSTQASFQLLTDGVLRLNLAADKCLEANVCGGSNSNLGATVAAMQADIDLIKAELWPPVDSGLIAKFEMEGNGADSSGNGYSATQNGGSFSASGVGGAGSQAFEVSGCNDMQVDGLKNHDWGSDFSVCTWFKRTSDDGNYQGIISTGYGGAGKWEIRMGREDAGTMVGGMIFPSNDADGNWNFGYSPTRLNAALNSWNHVCMTWDGSVSNYFLNGVLRESSTNSANAGHGDSGSLGSTSNPVFIGRAGTGTSGECFTGLIDNVRLYSKAVSQAEVTELYSGLL